MENQLSDSQILRNYYSNIYESTEYFEYKESEKKFHSKCNSLCDLNRTLDFLTMLLIASIYFSIFFVTKYHYFYIPLIIPFVLCIYISYCRTHKRQCKNVDTVRDILDEKRTKFEELLNKTEKPSLPNDKLTLDFIHILIKIFDSGRADTFKEALNIYEQDRQHEELMERQNSLIRAANNARMEAEQAQKAASKAQKEANYQKRQAEYYRREEEYYRNNR